jgi:hypothetical protein
MEACEGTTGIDLSDGLHATQTGLAGRIQGDEVRQLL